jgi:hypothetical protein
MSGLVYTATGVSTGAALLAHWVRVGRGAMALSFTVLRVLPFLPALALPGARTCGAPPAAAVPQTISLHGDSDGGEEEIP